jgi:predicted RNA binding protein YcfA (HicA-like mRNA interferase family)
MRRVDEEGRISTFPVPVHAGKTIKPGTLKGILRLAGLSDIELKKLL